MKLISLNIEEHKHLEAIKMFLEAEQPDVVCLQEVVETDVSFFNKILGCVGVFSPMLQYKEDEVIKGVALFAKDIVVHSSQHIGGSLETLPVHSRGMRGLTSYETINFQVLIATVRHGDVEFAVATTHFPVTAQGADESYQNDTLLGLDKALEEYQDIVLCGDFNAPRGGRLFTKLAHRYTDNIPASYETSIDSTLHRAGALPYMVDGLFTTDNYKTSDVSLRGGVSDHMAIVASVIKV
jgi:endonuclease/exonuclease/phosphatase family metal-dependent hydrolase